LLEPWDDACRGDVVGADVEVEGGPGVEGAEEQASVPVARAVDEDCNAIVVAVTAQVEARVAMGEAPREPDPRGHGEDTEKQYRECDDVHASPAHSSI
jgi:hypothetical protein